MDNEKIESDQMNTLKGYGCKWIFNDIFSNNTNTRQELGRMIESLSKNDTLIVTSLDQLSHSLQQLLALLGQLEQKKIKLISIDDAIDTKSDST